MITQVYVPIVIQHVQHALEIKVPTAVNALTVISNQINLQLLVQKTVRVINSTITPQINVQTVNLDVPNVQAWTLARTANFNTTEQSMTSV